MYNKHMLADFRDAGYDHPTVQAYVVNRAALRATSDRQTYMQLTIRGAQLWRAVADRAKRVRAARKGWATRRQ